MKLSIHEIWDDQGSYCYIEDQESGTLDVVGITFASKSEAQAYLDSHREEIERKGLPPLSPEDVAEYWQLFEVMEKKLDAGDLQIKNPWRVAKYLLRLTRQPVSLEESALRRIESVIARLNLMPENVIATALKSELDAQEAERKLDLARAYLELGDRDAALTVLGEVVRQGDDAYKDRARKMIGEISGSASSAVLDSSSVKKGE